MHLAERIAIAFGGGMIAAAIAQVCAFGLEPALLRAIAVVIPGVVFGRALYHYAPALREKYGAADRED